MMITHEDRAGSTVEFGIGYDIAAKIKSLPIPYQEHVERAFEEKVEAEFDRWQETMV